MYKGNLILLVICLIAMAAGTAVFFEASAYQKKAKVTVGTVNDRRISSYHVIYKSDDGAEHNMYVSAKNNKYNDGEKIKVFYQPNNPDNARITDGKKVGKVIIIIAFVMLLLDFYLIYVNRKKIKESNYFKTNGRKVGAEILGIDSDLSITFRGKHPYLINCKWTDPFTGKEYTHTIKNIWKDPAPFLAERNTIDVYIDKENPDKYFMDTEFLGDIAR